MIDAAQLRKQPDLIKKLIQSGRGDPKKANVEEWLKIDKARNELIRKRDELNQRRNELSSAYKHEQSEKIREEGKYLKEEVQKAEAELSEVTANWQEILNWMPNIPVKPLVEGKGEEDNIILKAWLPGKGYIKDIEGKKARGVSEKLMPEIPLHADDKSFTPKHHLDLGEDLGIIDIKQSSLTSGSRFAYITGELALLQYAIQQHLFGELIRRNFRMIIPPLMVKERVLYGTSHFPEGKEQVYVIDNKNVEDKNQLYLLGSTEPANFAYFMDKILNVSELPIKVFAYAPAFRSEVGSWGRDVKGIKRVHQFDKIEMNAICTAETSGKVFDEFLGINEWLLQSLELPYQLAEKCSGDSGYLAAAQQVDPEVWLPGQNEFIEVMTDTNTTDYQARGLNIRYRDANNDLNFAHTVNDTGCAMGRMLISILCNYQQKDGSIKVPEVLRKYTGFEVIKKK